MLESWKIEIKVSNGKKWWRKRGTTAIFIFHFIYYFFLVQNHTSIIKRKTKTKKPHQSHRELKRGRELSLPDNLLWGKVFQGRLWVGVTHVKYTDSSDLPEGERDGQSLLGKHLHHAAHGHFPFLELVRTWQENEPDLGKRKWAKKEAETLANQSPGEVEASRLGLSRLSGPEWSHRPRSSCHVVKNARAMWWTSLSERPRENNCVGKGDSDTGHRAKPREKNCSKDIATTLGFLRTPKPTASFNLGNDWRPLPDPFHPLPSLTRSHFITTPMSERHKKALEESGPTTVAFRAWPIRNFLSGCFRTWKGKKILLMFEERPVIYPKPQHLSLHGKYLPQYSSLYPLWAHTRH